MEAIFLSDESLGETSSKSKRVKVTSKGANGSTLAHGAHLSGRGLVVGGILHHDAFLDKVVEFSGADGCEGHV